MKSEHFGVGMIFGLLAAAAHAGPTWVENSVNPDAGSFRFSSQPVIGAGLLLAIDGRLKGGSVAAAGDYEDMFQITITDPVNFVAETAGLGTADFDTQLWLFDINGNGLLANDDADINTTLSRIVPPATDGTGQTIPRAGCYLLAITGKDDDPSSASGAIFNQASATEISGPDGAGGALAHTSWSGLGEIGGYTIRLTGAAFVARPCSVPTLSNWATMIMAALVLCAGLVILMKRARPVSM